MMYLIFIHRSEWKIYNHWVTQMPVDHICSINSYRNSKTNPDINESLNIWKSRSNYVKTWNCMFMLSYEGLYKQDNQFNLHLY